MNAVIGEAGERPLVLRSVVREPLHGMNFLRRALVLAELAMVAYNDEAEALRHYRWVHNNDIVTRVPPVWMGYRHGGDEIYLDRNGRIRKLTGTVRSRDRWRGLVGGLVQGRLDPLADHSIHLYIEHIARAAESQARAVQSGRAALDGADLAIRGGSDGG